MKGRNSQVARIYRTLNILSGASHGLSVVDILDRLHNRGFEVAKRTVYRDLDALREAGFPLDESEAIEGQATKWRLQKTTKVSHYIVLNSRELLSLFFARRVLAPLRDTPFYKDLECTFDKIEEKIGEKGQKHLVDLAEEFAFEAGPRWGLGVQDEILETLRAACVEQQVLDVNYDSANSGSQGRRSLGPHFLYFSKGALYLVAKDFSDNIVKTFSVARFQEAVMTDAPYEGETVDPEIYFEGAFGVYKESEVQAVTLEFSPKVSPFVRERTWHKSQRLIHKEGRVMQMKLDVSISPDLVNWVLGFGADVKVIEPQGLIEQICDRATATVSLYKKDQKTA
jgi:predicted DNA-binding transcriptional regulator YafY